MDLITQTSGRVERNTAGEINRRIRADTEARVAMLARQGPQAIARRLSELDREWDIERCLETGAASFTLVGSLLGFADDRRWFILPAAVGGFLLQHALQGWCPPLPVFRALGVRTADEINDERVALYGLPEAILQEVAEEASSRGGREAASG